MSTPFRDVKASPDGVNADPLVVLAERTSRDGRVRWQARISHDRARLEVVAIVPPNDASTVVPILTDAELRELLSGAPVEHETSWTCGECSAVNDRARAWCASCSSHPCEVT